VRDLKEVPVRVNHVIIFVSDMKRAVSFYRDVLGLPLRFESPDWTEFSTGDATVALHAAGNLGPDAPDGTPSGGWCRPGFSVPDLDEFHRNMVQRNVVCVQEPRDVFGARVAQYMDPDGLTFGVGEARPAK
jgi:lactoylglutathione lyase